MSLTIASLGPILSISKAGKKIATIAMEK